MRQSSESLASLYKRLIKTAYAHQIWDVDDFCQWVVLSWLEGKRAHQPLDYSAIDYIDMKTRDNGKQLKLLETDRVEESINEFAGDFERLVSLVPRPLHRDILRLFYVRGMTNEEIARVKKITLQMVYYHKREALQDLKKKLVKLDNH